MDAELKAYKLALADQQDKVRVLEADLASVRERLCGLVCDADFEPRTAPEAFLIQQIRSVVAFVSEMN